MSADFLTWLTAWLRRHPVQAPPADEQASYTAGVMARVGAPAPAYRWVMRPRISWALATAAACGMALMAVQRQPSSSERMAVKMAQDLQLAMDVLAAVGEVDPLSVDELEQDAVLLDQLMLAEAQSEVQDEAWIEETTELLNAVEDDPALEASNGESMEELLHELELLDEHEIASS